MNTTCKIQTTRLVRDAVYWHDVAKYWRDQSRLQIDPQKRQGDRLMMRVAALYYSGSVFELDWRPTRAADCYREARNLKNGTVILLCPEPSTTPCHAL